MCAKLNGKLSNKHIPGRFLQKNRCEVSTLQGDNQASSIKCGQNNFRSLGSPYSECFSQYDHMVCMARYFEDSALKKTPTQQYFPFKKGCKKIFQWHSL